MKIIETPRDGMQGLRKIIPTQLKADYINLLLKVGFDAVDVGSFVSTDAIPQLSDTAEVLKKLDMSKTKSKLMVLVANKKGGEIAAGFDEIKYAINEFNLWNDVILTGWIPEDDMPYFFNGASAFVFPSLYEGFGIPLLQSMACGTPITASRTASIPEIAGDSALYFNPEDVNDMSKALTDISTDQQLRDQLIKKGFEVIKNYSWEKCAQETLDVLKKV